ncbi:sterile alpha motif domain-containing protein 15 [Pezoporus occidentalis]|uniref:sterile alpha motif domain-containing protein 15 n=1 Tax=Pezoporus occidentalis TaxID=407982 RepID=UPI002F919CB6
MATGPRKDALPWRPADGAGGTETGDGGAGARMPFPGLERRGGGPVGAAARLPPVRGVLQGNIGCRRILVNCSNLPAIGVKDFSHMQEISRHVQELLGTEEPAFSRSIALPYRDNMGLFLERKSSSGNQADALTFSQFIKEAGLEPYTTVPPLQQAQTGVETDALPASQGTQRQD